MTRVDRILVELGCGPRTISQIMARLGCTEPQARAAMQNLINRLLAVRIDGVSPAKYRVTETGREYMKSGICRLRWQRAAAIQAIPRTVFALGAM